MLVFNVTFRCKPGMREAFLEKIKAEGIDVSSRAEPGNLQYDFFLSAENKEDLLLIEKYRDDAAVAAHVRQEHVARLVALKEQYVAELILEKYETTGEVVCFCVKTTPPSAISRLGGNGDHRGAVAGPTNSSGRRRCSRFPSFHTPSELQPLSSG